MEDFGYLKDDDGKTGAIIKKAALIGATLFSISCFIYVTLNAYNFIRSDQKNQVIETIKSPTEPIKVTEEYKYDEASNQNNGTKINKEIYEDIFGNKKEALGNSPTHIYAEQEPASPPPTIKESDDSWQVENQENDDIQNNNQAVISKPTNDQNNKIIVFSQNNKQNDQSQVLLGQKNQSTPVSKPKKRTIRVQIAAFNSKKLSKEYWDKLSHHHQNIFSGLKYFIEEADLGKKGIFYRLQIGNFNNQIDAENFCNRFVLQTKKTRSDCIIVE